MDDHFDFLAGLDNEIFQPTLRKASRHMTWREGFSLDRYNKRDCEASIRGEYIPAKLGNLITRRCVVRGIRNHPGFAEELHGALPLFTRAINARKIMSGHIPEIRSDDEIPYCTWCPDVASEESYRELASCYPSMKFLVGRACAVAGYIELYKELDLLPEVHIAEEAREAHLPGSKEIYNLIMASSAKYELMNDYTATLTRPEEAIPGAILNGDTAVRNSLQMRRSFEPRPVVPYIASQRNEDPANDVLFNITEDCSFDLPSENVVSQNAPPSTETQDMLMQLLEFPLPRHLPCVEEDVLIEMAAYEGNIDRYSRLRRPKMLENEEACIIRGIYHSATFARWWLRQQDTTSPNDNIQPAIHARFIMSNDLSRVSEEMRPYHEPYCVWYPEVAHSSTYLALACRNPRMKEQAARACIIGNYEDVFRQIDPEPTSSIMSEATASGNANFKTMLEEKMTKLGISEEDWPGRVGQEWKDWSTQTLLNGPTYAASRPYFFTTPGVIVDPERGIYDGIGVSANAVELRLCKIREWRQLCSLDLAELYANGEEPL